MPVVSPPDHNGSYDSCFIVVRQILFEKIAKIFFAAILGHFEFFLVAILFFTKINTCIFLSDHLFDHLLAHLVAMHRRVRGCLVSRGDESTVSR